MYGSLGKCLVEFAANAYDGDATKIEITLDADAIQASRKVVRTAAKTRFAEEAKERDEVRAAAEASALENGEALPPEDERPVISFVEDPLPGLTVTITDDGHGMSPAEVQNKFLPINRDRRADKAANGLKTEAGKRYVMGRKGIGKLSGFGAAMDMTVRTKRAGEDFATIFTLHQSELLDAPDIGGVPIVAVYDDNQPLEDHGTTITLSGLKCDSMKFTTEQLEDALANAFYPVRSSEFDIRLNGAPIARRVGDVEFRWPPAPPVPPEAAVDEAISPLPDGQLEAGVGTPADEDMPVGPPAEWMAEGEVGDDDIGRLKFRYIVKFKTKSLEAAKRGARIYCNNRLAFGPSLLDLKTGMHNFMAHQYMECIVEADALDRQNVDLISTDRGDLMRDNDLVDVFVKQITRLMERAIVAHGSAREKRADQELDQNPELELIRRELAAMPKSQRAAGRKVMRIMVARYGTESPEFMTVAPLVMRSMGAGEVLVNLIEIARNPKDMEQVLHELNELRRIEQDDALKIYRGRRDGIAALRKLILDGEDEWLSGKRSEAELQALLKDQAWIINPELSSYVTSDDDLQKVVTQLAKELGIDEFAPGYENDDKKKRDQTRPDLVFLLGDVTSRPSTVLIVELKSPNLQLEIDHLTQLTRYMRKVEEWLGTEYKVNGYAPRVRGILIGAMPAADTKADGCRDLLDRVNKSGAGEAWEVVGLRELVERTSAIHREMIDALEAHEEEDANADAEDSVDDETDPTLGDDADASYQAEVSITRAAE
ncbi:MAG: ATP-binding protein [Sphingomonas sp.]